MSSIPGCQTTVLFRKLLQTSNMSGQLFGDLELGKSFGISRHIKLKFSKSRVLLYASGNCLNAVDLNNSKEFKNENGSTENEKKDKKGDNDISLLGACHGDAHSKVLVGEGQITSFATLSKDNIIAYSEIYSSSVKIVRWASSSGLVTPIAKLPVIGDLSIIALSFSADGLYLAALGDLPEHQITIWDWRAQKQIISAPNGSPADFLSFNPMDSKQLCTSGKNGQIRFWDLKIGFKKYTMTSILGAKSPFDTFEEANKIQLNPWQLDVGENEIAEHDLPSPYQHMWIPDKKLLSINRDGTQIYKYNTENGLYEIFLDVAASDRKLISILQTSKNFYVAENGGLINVLNLQGDYLRSIKIPENAEIVGLENSPDYQRILIEVQGGKYFLSDLKKMQSISIKTENVSDLADLTMLANEKTMVSAHSNGNISFWVPEKSVEYQKMTINSKISCLGVSHTSSVLAVGSMTGVVRLYNAKDITYHLPKLLFRKRIHRSAVLKFAIDSTGSMIASAAQDGTVFLYNLEKCTMIGYIKFFGHFIGMRWEFCEEARHNTRLYVLQCEHGDPTSSFISVFELSEMKNLEVDEKFQISRNVEPLTASHTFTINSKINDFLVSPKATMSSKNIFYLMTADGHIKVFSSPSFVGGTSEKSALVTVIQDFKDHVGHSATFTANSNGEWIITTGSEGLITVRSIIEPEKSLKIHAHNVALGGTFACIFSYNYRHLLSMGHDGLVRRWDWKYNQSSRKAATELADSIERAGLEIIEVVNPIDTMNEVADVDDTDHEDAVIVGGPGVPVKIDEETLDEEKEQFKFQIQQKVLAITQKALSLMEMNNSAPELEKIDRSEFVIDLKEKERLSQETDNMIAIIRKDQKRKNTEKRVLRNRVKKECWDSCELVGQSVKSFKLNAMLGKQLEVTNYPIRKLSKEEALRISNIKRLRRVQMAVDQAFQKNVEVEKHVEVAEENPSTEAPAATSEKPVNHGETYHSRFLYDPFELNTKERRRIQSYILSENIQEIKANFNKTFLDIFKNKQDEISKIEEKNERIVSILAQLQMNEKVYKPELDDDEIPENIIKVLDSEVKVERFLNAEELAKIEAKRLQAEERLRLQGEDNFRQRALTDMMNGKLEDRKSQEEKEEIVRPEWMNKPKDEMNEDEKKLFKEFEKKMAIFKEEQEKHRKALETELRKLQAGISELQDAFDQKLFEFFQFKLNIDSIIYQKELSMIKQTQAAITADNDDNLEARLLERIDKLKQDKIECTNEIPEIKKELERCREEHDIVVKKDKDLEKQFKKEFHVHEIYFESLNRLFKRRAGQAALEKEKEASGAQEEDLNPFTSAEKDSLSVDAAPITLSQATDMPDGLSLDVWAKLLEIRDKKILLEQDVYATGRSLKEMQALVQSVLDESDSIKAEMEKTMADLNQFIEYKFRNIYNLECLFEFKQGQVEVPQAPIVTNYNDAVLVHRSVVENLNEQVKHLGQLKVEALTEMKDYRKGIHALEWENKMHDFQAEDLIIRSRDIQLLRVTKEMQEYLRNGDNHKQASEVSNLEKISEHSQKAHLHHIQEKQNVIDKIKLKRRKKMKENDTMKAQINELSHSVQERFKVQEAKLSRKPEKTQQDVHKELFTRRRLVDLAKSQAQDIAILREELERLRLRTYPAFRS